MKGDFERYLQSKETVDDRAFDRRVLDAFREEIRSRTGVRVLEAGVGTGAFPCRLLGWEGLPDLSYVAVDTDTALLATARDRIEARARALGFEVVDGGAVDDGGALSGHNAVLDSEGPDETETVATLHLRGPATIDIFLVAADARSVASAGPWDVLVAQAFVDLLSPADVERLVSGVVAGGVVYFPITFDGGTTFAPSHEADDAVLDAYHATMHVGERLGSTAGRRLLTVLPDAGVDVEAVGGSAWVVTPEDGEYPAEESYFLTVLLDTVADVVSEHVDEQTVASWLAARQTERAAGELRFVARNLDFFGRVRTSRT